jgi:hypothetical protein
VAPSIEHMLWYYAKGKPKDVIELEGRLNLIDEHMSDDELIARTEELLAKAKQHAARMAKPGS